MVTKVVRARDGNITNLMADNTSTSTTDFLLESDQRHVILEADTVNQCKDSNSVTLVGVESRVADGGEVECPTEAAYVFSTSVTCRVDVRITCESEEELG